MKSRTIPTIEYYHPELHTPAAGHLRAMADTWRTTVRKYDWGGHKGRLFLTGCRTGSATVCGSDTDHFRIYQIVTPGAHDVVGKDAAAHTLTHIDLLMAAKGAKAFSRSTAWSAAAADPLAVGKLKVASADVNADGFGDIVLFVQTDAGLSIETVVASYRTLKPDISASDGHDWSAITPY